MRALRRRDTKTKPWCTMIFRHQRPEGKLPNEMKKEEKLDTVIA